MPIQILSPRLANQIAAGEVVERPASVVKELVENSLDAGARRIDIDIERGGHKRILIRDDGKGIPKQELELALSRHATSKITSLDDLEHILSLGFRGEALASISSVSRLTLSSKPAEQSQAWQAHCEGRDMAIQLNPVAHPQGSSVEVKDLFFNTPARRKFLRTEKTEFNHIDEILRRIALSRFDVSFTLRHNGKTVRKYTSLNQVDSDPGQGLKRVKAVCGNGFAEHAHHISADYDGMTLRGWLTTPQGARAQNDTQYFYVNGRVMRDKLIFHAIRQAYEGLLPPETFPAFVLYFDIAPEQVDVNVHPAKHEVRFHQARLVHDFIFRTLNDGLNQALSSGSPEAGDGEQTPAANIESPASHQYVTPLKPAVSEHVAEARQSGLQAGGHTPAVPQGRGFASRPPSGRSSPTSATAAANYQQLMSQSQDADALAGPSRFHLQQSLWLVKHHEQLFVIDEARLALAQLQQQFARQLPVSQPLLMPVALPCDEHDKYLDAWQPQFQQLGIELAKVGQKLVLRQVPAGLRQFDWAGMLPDILATSVKPNQSPVDALFAMMATTQARLKQYEPGQLWLWYEQQTSQQCTDILNLWGQPVSVSQLTGVQG